MKLNKIAAASLLLVSGANFAATATVDICDKSTPLKFVNTCTPGATFFVAGSSALGGAIKEIVTSLDPTVSYFDTSVTPIVEIIDNATGNGLASGMTDNANKAGNSTQQWFGMSKAALTGGTSVPLLIIYNKYNGSAAGVSMVMSGSSATAGLASIRESNVVTVGPTVTLVGGKQITSAGTCAAYTSPITPFNGAASAAPATAASKVVCTTSASTRPDIAISDVDVPELLDLYPALSGGVALTKLTRSPLAMQGFGIAVSKTLYNALQVAQGLTTACLSPGVTTTSLNADLSTKTTTLIPSGDPAYTEACQPSISRAQYASLVTKAGSIKSAAALTGNSADTGKLVLARRDQLSGTQATSNIFFAGEVCNAPDSKSKIARGGALEVARATDSTATAATTFEIKEFVQSGDVTGLLKTPSAATDFVIGMVGLSNGSSYDYRFVKLDGVSPNFAKGDTVPYSSTNLRNNMVNGQWPLQMVAYAVYPTASATYDAKKAQKADLIKKLVADLSDASLHNLPAIGYFTGSGAHAFKKTSAVRVNYNNCSPLILK